MKNFLWTNSNKGAHMQKTLTIRMILLILCVFAAFALTGCDEIDKLIHPATGPGEGPGKPPAVSVVTVETQKVTLTTVLPGRTSPFRIAEIRPQISGLLLKRLFTEGSNVAAGQVLYQIDPSPFQAALDNANAALNRAKANLSATRLRAERYKDLLKDKAVSRQSYDDAVAALTQIEADIQSWKATVKSARINLDYTRITAPISGRIGRSNVTDGAIVTAYQPMALAVIQQLDPIYVDIPQSTSELLRLKNGGLNQEGADQNKVTLILEGNSMYSHEGKLQFSDVTVDQTTGSVILRAVFPNPEDILLPGMFVRAEITQGIKEQAILIPQQGVSRDPKGDPFALVLDPENKASFRPLTLDRAIGDKWLVASGLAPGDQVIVEGLVMLRPGTVVTATPFKAVQIEEAPANGPGVSPPKKNEGGAS
jgi:membrane fusion protein (multidrug efflux system)